jgi:hypothetical protein
MSFGARSLFLALSGQCNNAGNLAHLSYRKAAQELGIKSLRKIGEWFKELEHYGFIVLHRYGSLGVEGKGKAPQWRITDRGSKATGELRPTREFLHWNGVPYKPATLPRYSAISAAKKGRRRGHAMVNLDMCTTPGTVPAPHMCTMQGTVTEEGVYHAGNTTVDHAGNGVCTMQDTGFCFSGVTNAGYTSGDEHELATRFLAALSVRDRSPKD